MVQKSGQWHVDGFGAGTGQCDADFIDGWIFVFLGGSLVDMAGWIGKK